MTSRRRRPFRRWPLVAMVLTGAALAGVGIGSALSSPTHTEDSISDVSNPPTPTPPRDPPVTHYLMGVSPSPPTSAPSTKSPPPKPSRPSATPSTASAKPSVSKTPSRTPKVPTVSTSPTSRPPSPSRTPPPVRPSPSPSTPAPVVNPTGRLLSLINDSRRSTPGAGGDLARYVGMDAYAQGLADSHGPVNRGPYAEAVAVSNAPTAADAFAAMGPTKSWYTRVGIGFNSGYWIVVYS